MYNIHLFVVLRELEYISTVIFFFEYAGELHIISLRYQLLMLAQILSSIFFELGTEVYIEALF